jgi:hypothetical protein
MDFSGVRTPMKGERQEDNAWRERTAVMRCVGSSSLARCSVT